MHILNSELNTFSVSLPIQMTYMSVVWSAEKLGVAYYSVDSREIAMMLDATETEDMQLLRKGGW